MSKKISKKKQEVWDRLKNGIQTNREDTYEEYLTSLLAKAIQEEID